MEMREQVTAAKRRALLRLLEAAQRVLASVSTTVLALGALVASPAASWGDAYWLLAALGIGVVADVGLALRGVLGEARQLARQAADKLRAELGDAEDHGAPHPQP